jgi:tRNA-specific 2-thiouridylase
MQQHQATRARFPIGDLLKPDVREVARRHNLPNAEKKDSQGICFIGEVKMTDFLRNYVEDIPGNIVNQEGKILGRHRGLHLYTLGQRRGLGVASNTFKEAYVVVEKRSATRELVVAFDHPDTPGLYASNCRVSNVSVVNRPLTEASTTQSRPRYRTPSTPIDITPIDDTTFDVHFHEPQRALTPGQICAFYEEEILLGGGVFEHIETDSG